jgi:histidinol-phosphate aminotransferase
MMSRYWNPLVSRLSPYVPGEQPAGRGLIKLNTNEMPLGPSPRALQAIRDAADESLRLYPDPDSRVLKEALAHVQGLRSSQVFVGNGSDEVLAHTFRALFRENLPVLFPDITYSFYPVYGAFFGLDCKTVPLNAQFEIELEDYRQPNGGIIFPNPNAPTGILLSVSAIAKLLQENSDSVVVVDEAYVDFGGESATSLIDEFPNLLVVQTLSKSRALAGLRVGAAFGQQALIEGLERVKNSFNSYPIDRLAEAGAVAALQDEAWFRRCRDAVIANREWLGGELQRLEFEVLPSAANFLFASHPAHDAAALASGLREHGVIVRHFDKPRIDRFLRISVGDESQCGTVVAVLESLLG